jgi:hypothetical protein
LKRLQFGSIFLQKALRYKPPNFPTPIMGCVAQLQMSGPQVKKAIKTERARQFYRQPEFVLTLLALISPTINRFQSVRP